MGNIDTHRHAHRAFDRAEYDKLVQFVRDDVVYIDHPRGITVKGTHEFVDWLKGWRIGFSDAVVARPHYIDGGEYTVAVLRGRGTNDGPVGPLPASGKHLEMAFCEVLRYDADGRIASGELFYDRMTMVEQLGYLEPLAD